jgi:predicted nucleic acid-binding protein
MIFPTFVPPTRYTPKFVLGASVAVAWAVPRHYTVYTNRVQFELLGATAVVPAAWAFEVAEQFRLALQSGETTQPRIDRFVGSLALLPIYADDEGPFRAWSEVTDLARAHNVSLFDAAYLELSLRLNLPLAAADATLLRAAAATGVPVFTP